MTYNFSGGGAACVPELSWNLPQRGQQTEADLFSRTTPKNEL